MSALFPGLGQAYNKKYWKMPVIYAGFGGLGYAIGTTHTKYIIYRDAYIKRVDGDSTTIDDFQLYSSDNLFTLQDYYRRNRDLFIIGTAALYVLNIIDASVDAHLFSFNVSISICYIFCVGGSNSIS